MTYAIEKHNLTAECIYNWDEKGFLIGMAAVTKRIMSKKAYETGRITAASQDGNREFISLLACVSAVGVALPPALLYPGESGDLQDGWLQDLQAEEQAYFGVSQTGWSNDAFGLQWLQKVFQKHTGHQRRRLLIVDGHSSHVNMAFLNWATSNQIFILILPPHSTHRLQPLDVGLFQPLATAYTKQLNKLTLEGQGYVSMKKRHFFTLFRQAWADSFTEDNIQSAFKKAGIWPIDAEIVISQIQPPRPKTPLSTDDHGVIKTPYTAKAIRQMKKSIKEEPTQEKMGKVFKAIDTLQAKSSILEHKNKGLENAILLDKKTKGKKRKLNMQGGDACNALFWSTEEVLEAQAQLAAKDAEEEQKKIAKAQKKASAEATRKQKEEDKKKKVLERAIAREAAKEAKALREAEKREAKEAAKSAKALEKVQKKPPIAPPRARKAIPKPRTNAQASKAVEVEVQEEEVVLRQTRTRVVKPPPHFE